MISTRDIYHREWNDIKLAISNACLWHIVVMLTVVYNKPHGPWDSGAWFNKIRTQAMSSAEAMDSAKPPLSLLQWLDLCRPWSPSRW